MKHLNGEKIFSQIYIKKQRKYKYIKGCKSELNIDFKVKQSTLSEMNTKVVKIQNFALTINKVT